MKKILLLLFIFVSFESVCAETIVQGSITESAVWTKELSPYVVTSDIVVETDVELVIESGVEVRMYDNTLFMVEGDIKVFGTEDEPVVFKSNNASGGGYNSLILNNSNSSKLEHLHIFDSSGIQFFNTIIDIIGGVYQDMYVYEHSNISISDVEILNASYAVNVYDQSEVNISNTNIECTSTGISAYDASILVIDTTQISCDGHGIAVYDSSLKLFNSVISESQYSGIVYYSGISDSESVIKNNEFFGNGSALYIYDQIVFSENNIHDNTQGVRSFVSLDMRNNWWGDQNGPYHEIHNTLGIGDSVMGDDVTIFPWLTSWPPVPGYSSIAFIHGFEASRLYKQGSLFNQEDQLWEPNWSTDVRDLFMDENGVSVHNGIYTKDVIDQANVVLPTLKVYKTFIESMNDMVSSGEISGFKALPYDWRYSVLDIIKRGVVLEDGKISYEQELTEEQVPYMISEIEKLAQTSRNGKVTLVAHSNGGLVAKALVLRLSQMKEEGTSSLIDSIDKVIMVGTPQLGTPSALTALLHGTDQNIGGGIIMKEYLARMFGLNLPGAYGLLPSEEYFNVVSEPVVQFDTSLEGISNLFEKYGDKINSYDKQQSYALGILDERVQPMHIQSHINYPLVLNTQLYEENERLHKLTDEINKISSIEFINIAGWGLSTIKGIEYKKSRNLCILLNSCILNSAIEIKPITTSDGDKTVVTPSALYDSNKKYYFNLFELNTQTRDMDSFTHKNLFEIENIIELIGNIVKNNQDTPEFITEQKPESYDNLIVSMHSPVTLGVYDQNGRYTGVVSENQDFKQVKEEINGSSYFELGESKYISIPKAGKYIFKIDGISEGYFNLEIEQFSNNINSGSFLFENIDTTSDMLGEFTIEDGTVSKLTIDDNGDGIKDRIIENNEKQQENKIEDNISNSSGAYVTNSYKKIIKIETKKDTENTVDQKNGVEKDIKLEDILSVENFHFIKQNEETERVVEVDFQEKSNTDIKYELIMISLLIVVMVYSSILYAKQV